jgi:L-aminopeptidase/D-esterase-like protein
MPRNPMRGRHRWRRGCTRLRPGRRETDLLGPTNAVQPVQAIQLSGGSAYGLEEVRGVMRYLEECKLGFKLRAGAVPILPTAILFDLGVGDFTIRPDTRPASPPGQVRR